MNKDHLDTEQTVAISPAADKNVAAISPCCLDVNLKSAYIMKGRGGGVWLMIWIVLGSIFLFCLPLGDRSFNTLELAIGLTLFPLLFGLSILRFIHMWRTHLPMRFSRQTRKVYFHHRNKTYIQDWDTIRANLALQKGVTATGTPIRDEQVNIEFKDETGKTITILLMGTQKGGLSHMEGAAALWEYIRVYMEEGPEGLPAPEPWIPDANSIQDILKSITPFPINTKHWWLLPFELAVFFPFRVVFFIITFPTDIIYFHLEKRIKIKPFPPELEAPCRCQETPEEQQQRIADVLLSYDTRLEEIHKDIRNLEQALMKYYNHWFVKFRYPGIPHTPIVDGVPEGWHKVPLTDLVEINPPLNISAESEIPYVTASTLPDDGMLIERDRLEWRNASDSNTFFRNGDVLFPLTSPQLERGQAAIVSFLSGYEVANTNSDFFKLLSGYEVGSASADLIVMRGINISPGFTFCLASNSSLREHLQNTMGDPEEGNQALITAIKALTVPMPPLTAFNEFENNLVKPHTQSIMTLEMEAQYLLNERNRLLTNTASLRAHSESHEQAAPVRNKG